MCKADKVAAKAAYRWPVNSHVVLAEERRLGGEVDQADDLAVVVQLDGVVGPVRIRMVAAYIFGAADLHLPERDVGRAGVLASEQAFPGDVHVLLEQFSVAFSVGGVPACAVSRSTQTAHKGGLDGGNRRVILVLAGGEEGST